MIADTGRDKNCCLLVTGSIWVRKYVRGPVNLVVSMASNRIDESVVESTFYYFKIQVVVNTDLTYLQNQVIRYKLFFE